MTPNLLPFNIDLLIPTPRDLKLVPEVQVLDIFKGSNRTFHPLGLFSTESFGRVGEERRNRTFGFINLKASVFHPVVYKALTDLKVLYGELLAGSSYAQWDPVKKDFIKAPPTEGDTGFHFFLSHFEELEFEERKSTSREFNIRLLQKYRQNCLMDKLLVLPAGLRDFEFDDQGRPREDEVNTLYRQVLGSANLIQTGVYHSHPETLDDVRYSLQVKVNDIYAYFKRFVEGKKKMIQGRWATRQIFNGTLNVITSLTTSTEYLNSPRTVSFNQTMVGLYQYLKAILPLAIYQIRSGFLSQVFVGPNSPAVLVNQKTLKKEHVDIDPGLYDDWMTDEGLEKTITRFGEEDLRDEYLTVGHYYFGLLYRGPDGTYALLQDIEDLPEGYDKAHVMPLTFCELLYLSVYKKASEIPCFITRYPITGYGSTYPSYVYLKSTVRTEVRKELNAQFVPTGAVAYEFPLRGETFMNSLSPHQSHLGRLGADHDGDRGAFNCVVTEEAKANAKRLLNSRNYYVGVDGRMSFSAETDVIELVLSSITS
jgi:hypothetical protein